MMKKLLLNIGIIGLGAIGYAQTNDTAPSIKVGSEIQNSRLEQFTPKATQAVLWGFGSAVQNPEAEFANAFVEATAFAPGDNTTSWTALSVNDATDGSSAAYWTRNTQGFSQGAYWSGTTPVGSQTQANGVAIFDSDFLDNGGVAGAFGSGTSPSPHRGELISPRIDLTGLTDSEISVSFFSFYRNFGATARFVGVSVDDGATWTDVEYSSFTADQTQERLNIPFTGITNGVTNLTQCRVRFTFDGDYYFAIVDDVAVEDAINYDLAIGVISSAQDATIAERGSQIHFTGNKVSAITQLTDNQISKSAGANFLNLGIQEIPASLNPRIEMLVEKDNEGSFTQVYTLNMLSEGAIPATSGSTIGLLSIPDDSWIEVGNYRVTYTAAFDGVEDGPTTNNSIQHNFVITNDDLVSKVSVIGNGFGNANRGIFPGGAPYAAMEYGSIFTFADIATQQFVIDEIRFTYRLSPTFSGAADQTLFANVYEVDTSTGTFPTRNELTKVAVGTMSLTGLGTTPVAGDFGFVAANDLANPTTGVPFAFGTAQTYLVTVQTEPSLTGGVAGFDGDDVPNYGVVTTNNYELNAALNNADGVTSSGWLALTDPEGTESVFGRGFGLTNAVSIVLDTNSLFTLSTEQFSNGQAFTIYPNPSKDGLINLELGANHTKVSVQVYDLSGRLLNTYQLNSISSQIVNLSDTRGLYLIKLNDIDGSSVSKKVIVK